MRRIKFWSFDLQNQRAYKSENDDDNSTLIPNEAFGVSCPSTETKLLCSFSGGDGGGVDKQKNEEACNLGQSSDDMTTKLSSFIKSFIIHQDNIQSLVSSLVLEQIQLKSRLAAYNFISV